MTGELIITRLPAATWTVDTALCVTSWHGGNLATPESLHGAFAGRALSEVQQALGLPPGSIEMHKQALEGISSDYMMSVSQREYLVNLSPLRGGGDTIIGVVGVALEVTAAPQEAEKLLKKANFDRVLSTFLGQTLRQKIDDRFYQRLVGAAIEMVPGAEAGSFWVVDGGRFRAVAAVGLEIEAFDGLLLKAEELSQKGSGTGDQSRVPPSAKDAPRANLNVSVNVEGRPVAFLNISGSRASDGFDDDAREFAQLFADVLSALFEHADLQRTLGEERRSLERLLAAYKELAEFGAEIETIHDTDALIEHGAKSLLQTFRFDTAMFSEIRGGEVHFTRVLGKNAAEIARIIRAPQPLGAGVNGRVAATGEPLGVEDYPSWPLSFKPYAETGVRSMLALPIRKGGRVVHTIAFATIDRHASIDDNMIRIAGGFAKRLENAFERAQHLDEIRSTREATFRSLGVALEFRDLETRGHTDRVVKLAKHFGKALGLSREESQALVWGAYLHDLGKIAVPDALLLKPGRLTEEEFEVIRKHTLFGVDMLRDIPFLPTQTRELVRSHHERWDGNGYPERLAGKEIPFLARMFSLVDVYDALRSKRPYKRAWTQEEAVAELAAQAGKQFDPELTTRFLEALPGLT
ncbi:MAG TPA: HD domain-containing phosphohydrolase [Trueperaceae bacterium]|nr:HD domain-containing phosphohydrolase [Trueperaceae bacterium]